MIGKAALDVIYIYHAFRVECARTRYKNYAETLDRKLDAPIDQTAQYKIVADIQKSLPRDRHSQELQREGHYRDNFKCQICPSRPRAILQKIATQNVEDSQAISAEISPIFLSAPVRMKFDRRERGLRSVLEIL